MDETEEKVHRLITTRLRLVIKVGSFLQKNSRFYNLLSLIFFLFLSFGPEKSGVFHPDVYRKGISHHQIVFK